MSSAINCQLPLSSVMGEAKIVVQNNGQFAIVGIIDFTTVNQLLVQGEKLFLDQEAVVLDLAAVSGTNSVALALLLEWQDQARKSNKSLHICNVPRALLDIARISNCVEVLNCIS